jgi:hypothetical protein
LAFESIAVALESCLQLHLEAAYLQTPEAHEMWHALSKPRCLQSLQLILKDEIHSVDLTAQVRLHSTLHEPIWIKDLTSTAAQRFMKH